MDVIDLLRELAAGPNLPGAACVEHRDVFDGCTDRRAGPYTYVAAIRVCAGCPALAPCRAWVADLPPRKRPVGVTGALVRRNRSAPR